jgi:hypothetical protein
MRDSDIVGALRTVLFIVAFGFVCSFIAGFLLAWVGRS